jgi:virulence-associated protein VapD
MFAITFDLVVAETNVHHPKNVTQAYTDIAATLARSGFERIQGSVYVQAKGHFESEWDLSRISR